MLMEKSKKIYLWKNHLNISEQNYLKIDWILIMATALALTIMIVEKLGSLKTLSIKDFKEEELYKKCGFKKAGDFLKQPDFKKVKVDGKRYWVSLYGKTEGKAGGENKYDFPPPNDQTLFFGSCAVVAKVQEKEGDDFVYVNLSVELWNKIYEKLFGGFEDLVATAKEDEDEMDELELIPKEKKTKDGYLKDGFVVDSSDPEEEDDEDLEESGSFEEDTENSQEEFEEGENLEDEEEIGSELSEESYI